jgi:cytoskeletal protein RodZ
LDNLGQYLRELREEKNLTITAVQKDTKLSLEQIDSMETNRLTRLGNHGIARAMVYTYVRFLGADEAKAMYLFDLGWPPLKHTKFNPQTPLKEKKVLISTNFIWMISIIILAVILGSIIWISYTKGYLKRPFDSLKKSRDSLTTELPVVQKVEKQDTVRTRMLEIARTQVASKDSVNKIKQPKPKDSKTAFSDTTDYENGLIFDSKSSPFNPDF